MLSAAGTTFIRAGQEKWGYDGEEERIALKMAAVKEMFPLYTPTLRGASPRLPSHLIIRERRNPFELRPGGTYQAYKTVRRPLPRQVFVFVGRTVGGLLPNTFVITGDD